MPKSLASTSLCRRHRRSRQYNLCNMVALLGQQQQLNHGAVPTTRIVSEEDMMTHDLSSIVLNDDSNHSSVIASCRSDESMDDDYSSNHHSRIISPCASLCKTEAASTVAAATTTTTENQSSAQQVTPALSSVNSRSSGTFLRRPSPSVCLADLGDACIDADEVESSRNDVSYRSRACSMDSIEGMPSLTKASSAASPWGYFVDMQIPEDDEVSHSYNCMTTTSRRSTSPSSLPFLQVPSISPQNCYYSLHSWKSASSSGSPNDPYPRRNVAQSKHNSNRIPLSFSKRFLESKNQATGNEKEDRESILEGFILLNPELDETTHRLSSLSF